jgi:hypothetical protein
MSDSLATLTSKLQALLLDDGTLFSSGTCAAAIRQALTALNLRLPVHAGTTVEVVAGQCEYELTEALAGATPIEIIDVLRADPSGGEGDTSLDYDSYIEDERWFVRLHTPQASGDLIVRFTQPHTISGLDGASESTLPSFYDPVLLDGAAAEACAMAAAGKVESNNLDPAAPGNYARMAAEFASAFESGLRALALKRFAQKGGPDRRTWEDLWHNSTWQRN